VGEESYYDFDVYNLAKLVRDVGAPLGDVLRALYRLQRAGELRERWAIVNPGCDAEDLAAAEANLGHPLAPLHRALLQLSNGGTLPYMNWISWLAAAVAREREWRIAGPFVASDEEVHVINVRQQRPIAPSVLGAPLEEVFAGDDVSVIPLDDFLPFAGGFGGEVWGYVRGTPGRIDMVFPPFGRNIDAHSFEDFLLWQPLYDECAEPHFRAAVRAALERAE
jgi:hypothetical protein